MFRKIIKLIRLYWSRSRPDQNLSLYCNCLPGDTCPLGLRVSGKCHIDDLTNHLEIIRKQRTESILNQLNKFNN